MKYLAFFLAFFIASPAYAALEYTRTPSGPTPSSPILFQASVSDPSEWALEMDSPYMQLAGACVDEVCSVIQPFWGTPISACYPSTELYIEAEIEFPVGYAFDSIFVYGFNDSECNSDFLEGGPTLLEGSGDAVIFTVSDIPTPPPASNPLIASLAPYLDNATYSQLFMWTLFLLPTLFIVPIVIFWLIMKSITIIKQLL